MISDQPVLDLSTLEWSLTGWRPFAWKLSKSAETGGQLLPDVGPVPAKLPGSVQQNLLRAGTIPDWHIGRNSLAIEWVEHRQWMFSTTLPPLALNEATPLQLCADVFDHSGWVLIDGAVIGEFRGAHLPVRITLGHALTKTGVHELAIVFDLPPEGQGQLGYTSHAREMKPRYSFSWDWCVRVIPIGAAGRLTLVSEAYAALQLRSLVATLSSDFQHGSLQVILEHTEFSTGTETAVVVRLRGNIVASQRRLLSSSDCGLSVSISNPELWWPEGEGAHTLYEVEISVTRDGKPVRRWTRDVGFKHIEWRPCTGAPPDALPWLCAINGRPIFLQGVNWTPVRMCYLDTQPAEVERLVAIYRDLGCNLLRVWGGAYLETPEFYSACDRAGLLLWQEFPLSSSGIDSDPPQDPAFIAEFCNVALHFIRSRQHHACLLQWCGGNELHRDERYPGGKRRIPLDLSHPLLAALGRLVKAEDPSHRFLPTSPFGPRFHSEREEFGLGLHHEVHGPWGVDGYPNPGDWERYWRDDDALFRGETGVAGASSLELIQTQSGGEAIWPPTVPLWRHSSDWWTQWTRLGPLFEGLHGEAGLVAYIEFTQGEQAEKLSCAVQAKKDQFPRCGGFLIWMGHDAFPCLANTSIVEFDHRLKPAAHAVARVFHSKSANTV